MGHRHYLENEAVEGLANLFRKANYDLLLVQHKLEEEFQQIYLDNANPVKLVSRIKKIQEELPSLKKQCRELLSAKQDLIDKARRIIVGNRSLVQRMQASMGIPVISDSDDLEFAIFNEIIDEWTAQVTTRTGSGILLSKFVLLLRKKPQKLEEVKLKFETIHGMNIGAIHYCWKKIEQMNQSLWMSMNYYSLR